MNWKELKERIIAEYDKRELKSNVRYQSLEKIGNFLEHCYPSVINDIKKLLQEEKEELKRKYAQEKGKEIIGTESSVINEIYKLLFSGNTIL